MVEHVQERHAGLLEFFSLHAAGGVQHHDHVLGDGFFGDRNTGCGQQHEVPLAGQRVVGAQQVGTDLFLRNAEVQLEVGRRGHTGGLVTGDDVGVVRAVDGNIVAGGVDSPDRCFGRDGDPNRDLLERLSREALSVQAVDVADQPLFCSQHLLVGDLNPTVLTRRDREHPRHERSPARVLQQGGVPQPVHDLLIGAPRRVGVQELGFDSTPVHPHREVGDRRVLGDREEVGPFGNPVIGVVKDLVDLGSSDLILNRDVDLVVPNGELIGNHDGIGTGVDITDRWLDHNQTVRARDGG